MGDQKEAGDRSLAITRALTYVTFIASIIRIA
jgi:hypothetical protein